MKVITHQQVEGVEAGTTITVDAEKAEWLITNGYASAVDLTDTTDDDTNKKPAAKRAAKKTTTPGG